MNKNFVYLLCASIFSCSMFALTPVIAADKQAAKQIKFRQSGYMFMRWNMGKIKKQVIKKPESYNKEQVIAAANVIDAVAHSGIEKLFTPNTKTGKGWKETRVKPAFFDNADEISKIIAQLKANTSDLVVAADRGDINSIKTEFHNTLKTCKSCHKKYRAKI